MEYRYTTCASLLLRLVIWFAEFRYTVIYPSFYVVPEVLVDGLFVTTVLGNLQDVLSMAAV